MNRKLILLSAVFLSVSAALADALPADAAARLARFWSDKTSLCYNCPTEGCEPAASFTDGFRAWSQDFGYGRGMEDSAIMNGIALSLAVDAADGDFADRAAQGLLNLATVHGVPGFVARGICIEDGRSVCTLSSRDQITHFVHGLYRYATSPLVSHERKAEIARAFAAVADRMRANVTEANEWNALTADGRVDPKGILRMWRVKPHEAARLPMVYLAAWRLTGEERFRLEYEKYADAALDQSLGILKLSDQERQWTMPGYSFVQMNASLEVIREADPSRADRAKAVMREVARLAVDRFLAEKGADGPWLSAAGDLAYAVAMGTGTQAELRELVGPSKTDAFNTLLRECLSGTNGQPKLSVRGPARLLSLFGARKRFDCMAKGATEPGVGFVQASGRDLIDSVTGAKVALRGVNAGGWLLTENWMCPTAADSNKVGRCQYELDDVFRAKFGAERAEELWDVYRDAWWQEQDFRNVKDLGLNCIRLPFGWRELITPAGQTIEKGFARLDWFVEGCRTNGLYVILDLHGAPGSQNGRDHSGEVREHRLTSDPAAQDLCRTLWQALATRYRDSTTVAGYDFLNEPEGAPGGNTSTNGVVEIYNDLYKAVRAVDPNHLVILAACWEPRDIVAPSVHGWDNVCYEYHFYEWGKKAAEEINAGTDRHVQVERDCGHGVPVFVGEFNLFDPDAAWDYGLKAYNEQGWHWAIWTYKVVGAKTNWGLYHGLDRTPAFQVSPADDFETVRRKFARTATSESFTRNAYAETVRRHAAE